MTELDKEQNAFETSGTSPPAEMTAEERKQNRTLGLKTFDLLLYPILNNFIVFGTSVAATYFTSRGNVHGGKVGKFLHWRGEQFQNVLQNKVGLNEKSAEMAKIVAFSFGDGILLAPVVKIFEDRRERIGKWLDDKFGTTPENLAIYEAEPKQTWGSVLKGRIAAGAVVLPTAIAFDVTGVNAKLFDKRGQQLGSWIESKPSLARKFGSADIKELSRIGIFEAVYTSICTGALYVFSRMFARKHDEKIGRIERDPVSKSVLVHAHATHEHTKDAVLSELNMDAPSTTVSAVQAQARVAAEPHEHALHA